MPRESELFLREFGRAQEIVWVPERELEKQAGQAVKAAEEGRVASKADWEKAEAQVFDAFGKEGKAKPDRKEAERAVRTLLGIGVKQRERDGSESHTLRRRWTAAQMVKVESLLEWLRVECVARKLVNELLVEGGVAVTEAVARLVTAPMTGKASRSVQNRRRSVLAKYTRPGSSERERTLVIRKNNEVVRVLGIKTHRTREEDEVLREKRNARAKRVDKRESKREMEEEEGESGEGVDVLGMLLASDDEEGAGESEPEDQEDRERAG